jgi:hypothetical protein
MWLAVVTVLVLLVSTGVWFNRGSEKILTAFAVGLTAIVGALVSLLVFGAPAAIRKALSTKVTIDGASHFPADFIAFEGTSNLPADIIQFGAIPESTDLARDLLRNHPELRASDDTFGMTLYHHLLQRGIVRWLQKKYVWSWEAEVFPFDLGEIPGYMFTSKSTPSSVYGAEGLARRMGGNKFAHLYDAFWPNQLAVPHRTELYVTPPHQDKELGEVGKITLKNRFSTITIETRAAGSQLGLGSYALLFGLSEEQSNEFRTNRYLVIIDASFTWFLAGNPDMPRYRKWASDIATGLQDQFDERVTWSQVRDHVLLRRELASQPAPRAIRPNTR